MHKWNNKSGDGYARSYSDPERIVALITPAYLYLCSKLGINGKQFSCFQEVAVSVAKRYLGSGSIIRFCVRSKFCSQRLPRQWGQVIVSIQERRISPRGFKP